MDTKPTPGNLAPNLELKFIGGETFSLKSSKPQLIDMLVFYRGYHCPLCKDFLHKLNGLAGAFLESGANVVAVSMDTEERAQKSKEEWGLDNLSIAYGLSEEAARAWGLHITESIKEVEPQTFSEPALFWVLADKKIYLMDVASMPFARPDLELLLAKVPAITAGYPARGTK